MSEEYSEEFKFEQSDSSSLGEEELQRAEVELGMPSYILGDARRKLAEEHEDGTLSYPAPSVAREELEDFEEFKPYTFNIQQHISTPPREDAKKLKQELEDDPLFQLRAQEDPDNAASDPEDSNKLSASGEIHKINYLAQARGSPYISQYQELLQEPGRKPMMPKMPASPYAEDPAVARGTEDYKEFEKEFEKDFGSTRAMQAEMDDLSNRIVRRYQNLDNLISELESEDVDSLLFRNKMVREISDVKNDLKEANNNVMSLMKDRVKMKDQFCLLQVKHKKIKGAHKALQDDSAARGSAFKELTESHITAKEELGTARSEIVKALNSLAERTEENARLKRGVAEQKQDIVELVRKLEEYREECEKRRREMGKLVPELREKQGEIEHLLKLLNGMKEKNKDTGDRLQRMEREHERKESELERLSRLGSESQTENKRLWSENSELKAQFSEARSAIEKLLRDLKAYKSQAEELAPQNEKQARVIEEMRKKIMELQERNAQLMRDLREIAEDSSHKLGSASSEAKGLKGEAVMLRTENERLKQNISEIIEDIKQQNEKRRVRKEGKARKMMSDAKKKKTEVEYSVDSRKQIEYLGQENKLLDKYKAYTTKPEGKREIIQTSYTEHKPQYSESDVAASKKYAGEVLEKSKYVSDMEYKPKKIGEYGGHGIDLQALLDDDDDDDEGLPSEFTKLVGHLAENEARGSRLAGDLLKQIEVLSSESAEPKAAFSPDIERLLSKYK